MERSRSRGAPALPTWSRKEVGVAPRHVGGVRLRGVRAHPGCARRAGRVGLFERGPSATVRSFASPEVQGSCQRYARSGAGTRRRSRVADADVLDPEHRAAFLDALLARDSARARRVIEAALARRAGPRRLPRRARTGAARGRPPLGDGRDQRRRGALRDRDRPLDPRRPQPPVDARPADGRLAIVSGTPEEQHALGMRMVADFLEADGWEVLMLGAGAPAHDLVPIVEPEQPDVVALSTATAGVLDGVVEVLGALARALPAAVSRRRRPVLDGRDEPDGARARRRPRVRTRASSSRACTADPAASMIDPRGSAAHPTGRGACWPCSTRRSRGWSSAGRPASGARSRSRSSTRGSPPRREWAAIGGLRIAEARRAVGAIVLARGLSRSPPRRCRSATSRRWSRHGRTRARRSAASSSGTRSRRPAPPG